MRIVTRRATPYLLAALTLAAATPSLHAQTAAQPASTAPASASTRPRVLDLRTLNTEQIRRLDRAKTVVVMPAGILEEHGPYLPSYSDGYLNERLAAALADSIAARSGWTALVFPVIPLGTGPANEVGPLYSFPGSYPVRSATLRSIYMDLADELGRQGFRWAFIIHGHGAPNHNRALDDAGDYFRDIYGGHMVHLLGMLPIIGASELEMTAAERQEDGMSIHAGLGETSTLLFHRPDLVDSAYKSAKAYGDTTWEGLSRIGAAAGWPGYFGAPRSATRERGAASYQGAERAAIKTALDIVDGRLDERRLPRLGDVTRHSPGNDKIDRASLAYENASRKRQDAWISRHAR